MNVSKMSAQETSALSHRTYPRIAQTKSARTSILTQKDVKERTSGLGAAILFSGSSTLGSAGESLKLVLRERFVMVVGAAKSQVQWRRWRCNNKRAQPAVCCCFFCCFACTYDHQASRGGREGPKAIPEEGGKVTKENQPQQTNENQGKPTPEPGRRGLQSSPQF